MCHTTDHSQLRGKADSETEQSHRQHKQFDSATSKAEIFYYVENCVCVLACMCSHPSTQLGVITSVPLRCRYTISLTHTHTHTHTHTQGYLHSPNRKHKALQ